MALTPEKTQRLLAINQAVLAGTDTPDMLREGVALLREDRVSAGAAGINSRTKRIEAAKPVDTTAALSALKALGTQLKGTIIPAQPG